MTKIPIELTLEQLEWIERALLDKLNKICSSSSRPDCIGCNYTERCYGISYLMENISDGKDILVRRLQKSKNDIRTESGENQE